MFTMTRIRSIAGTMLLFVNLSGMQSCKKSSGGGAGATNTSGYYLTATVNGKDWAANVPAPGLSNSPSIAVVQPINGVKVVELIGFDAINKDTTALVLLFPLTVTINQTLTFDANKYLEGAYVAQSAPGVETFYGYNTTPATGGSGTITITSIDQTNKVIEGNFSGVFGSQTGRPAIPFTNGKFRCIYTTDASQRPPTGVKF